jgi:hypothetical protein
METSSLDGLAPQVTAQGEADDARRLQFYHVAAASGDTSSIRDKMCI